MRKTRFTGSARRTSAASISGSKTTQHSDPEQGDSLLRFFNGPAPFIDNFGRFLYIVASGSYITEGRLTAQMVYVGDESYAGRLTREAKKTARPDSRLMHELNRLIRFDSMVLVPLGILLFRMY